MAGGWLAGKFGEGKDNKSRRSAMLPSRYDLTIPANQRKLDAVNQLNAVAGEAGISLIELAVAFVLEHPTISSAIIGPRTMEQLDSQLSIPDIQLDDAVLDRIDEIVPPGTNVNVDDDPAYWPVKKFTVALSEPESVSYTHLDVYKRQP